AGVDTLVPSRKGIAQGALDDRRTRDRGGNRVARGKNQLLAKTLAVAVSVGPAPAARALEPDLLEAFFNPSLAPSFGRGLVNVPSVRIDQGQLVGLARLIMRFRLDPRGRGERVADFAPERKIAPAVGTPIDRDVVLEAMPVGVARGIAGRDVKQG